MQKIVCSFYKEHNVAKIFFDENCETKVISGKIRMKRLPEVKLQSIRHVH